MPKRKLNPREEKIADLLLNACSNAEIARELGIAVRTVKAHFNRMFLIYGVTDGIKRVKLAVLLYRERTACDKRMGKQSRAAHGSADVDGIDNDRRNVQRLPWNGNRSVLGHANTIR